MPASNNFNALLMPHFRLPLLTATKKFTKNWSHLPLVSMTSNMFLRLSGRASARMSLLAAAQNWPTRSNMESHSAEKVGRLQRY